VSARASLAHATPGGKREGGPPAAPSLSFSLTPHSPLSSPVSVHYSQPGQAAPADLTDRASARAALEAREASAAAGARADAFDEERERDLLLLESGAGGGAGAAAAAAGAAPDRATLLGKRKLEVHPEDADDVDDVGDDDDDDDGNGRAGPGALDEGRGREEGAEDGGAGASPSSSSDDDGSDSDDEAALLAELDRIKAERAEAAAAAAAADASARTGAARAAAMQGNPLLAGGGGGGGGAGPSSAAADPVEDASFEVARRWDDDVVFRHQARGAAEAEAAKAEFVNDTVRNNFHKRFLDRYIR